MGLAEPGEVDVKMEAEVGGRKGLQVKEGQGFPATARS